MSRGLAVPASMEPDVRAFLASSEIGLELVSDAEAAVRVLPAAQGDRPWADAATLYAGGRIRCADALGMAPRLGISTRDLGRILDHLDVKVRDCSLGCFP